MPTYEFQCDKCETIVEEYQAFNKEYVDPICCDDSMRRLISATPAIFKGSGWYSKDKK